jgi:hypothetical protein
VAKGSQEAWEKLLPDPGSGVSMDGTYVALLLARELPAGNWTPWAARQGAFCEGMDALSPGFLIPPQEGGKFPLQALDELRKALPGARLAAVRGSFSLAAEEIFDSVRWSLKGQAKDEALALLRRPGEGSFCVVEADYVEIRQNVKIQLLGEAVLSPGTGPKKIFNIIAVF